MAHPLMDGLLLGWDVCVVSGCAMLLWNVVTPGKGGGEGVAYGHKGKGILIHSITDANGMPLVAITTPANGDERQQVLTMLAQIRLATGFPR